MAFTAAELENITNSVLNHFLGKGEVYVQAIQEKPMLKAFDDAAGTFPGGRGEIEIRIKKGDGGLSLSGYTHDDTVTFDNPTPVRVAKYPWKEHHIGMGLTHTELKHDGITVNEEGANQTLSNKSGRDQFVLAGLLQEKIDSMNEDYLEGMDGLIHGDGTGDVKALAGIQSIILPDPSLGATGGFARTNTWWRNRAATADADAAGSGDAPIVSTPANGGALLQYLQGEYRQIRRYARQTPKHKVFAGSDFIGAMEVELRANGNYASDGFRNRRTNDGGMNTDAGVPFKNWNFVYDPTLDDLGFEKRAYVIDMNAIKLLYMQGEKMKRANPPRPHDKYVNYRAITTTAAMIAKQLNTSAVYDIA